MFLRQSISLVVAVFSVVWEGVFTEETALVVEDLEGFFCGFDADGD